MGWCIVRVAGYSKLWEADDGSDSVFYIWVGVEITDHPLTTHGAYHNIDMSVFVADELVTGEKEGGGRRGRASCYD